MSITHFRLSIDYFCWRGAMFILAGVVLNNCVTAALMFPAVTTPTTTSSLSKSKLPIFNIHILKDANFVLYMLSFSLLFSQMGLLYQLSPSWGVSKGMPILQASFLPTIIGIVSTIGRFTFSWINNMSCTSHIGVHAVCGLGTALAVFGSCFRAGDFTVVIIFLAIGGFNFGEYELL